MGERDYAADRPGAPSLLARLRSHGGELELEAAGAIDRLMQMRNDLLTRHAEDLTHLWEELSKAQQRAVAAEALIEKRNTESLGLAHGPTCQSGTSQRDPSKC